MRALRWLPSAIVCLMLSPSGVACSKPGRTDLAAPMPSSIRIASPDEPGQPLEIRGSYRDEHGEPVANRVVRVSQDDASGAFDRLSGTLRTDAYGRFLVRTVFPLSHGASPGQIRFQAAGGALSGGPVAVLELSAPDARGTAGNGIRVTAGTDGVWRVSAEVRPGYNGPEHMIPVDRPALPGRATDAAKGRAGGGTSRPVRTRFTLEDSARSGR
jgi:hypothetical protein